MQGNSFNMAEKYFDKFKLTYYANTLSIDITERAVMLNSVKSNPYLFYPADLIENVRPDQIADNYYEDQYMSWLIYLSNGVVDPYYDWYLSETEFNSVIEKKYKTPVYLLQEKVKFYRNNWFDTTNDKMLPAVYDGLTNNVKMYWEPAYGNNDYVYAYTRKKQDWTINTNGMRLYSSTSADYSTFVKDEIVDVVFDENYSGRGQVAYSNTSSVTLQHVSGYTYSNSTVIISMSSQLSGRESNTIVPFEADAKLTDNISEEEYVYWAPVSIYDYENELNSKNKSIKILNKSYSMQTSKELKALLK